MQEPSSPLDRRMNKFADAIVKMREAMSDVMSGIEAIPIASHPFQSENNFIMGALLRYKDECNLHQIISNRMIMEYDGSEFQLNLLQKAKLVQTYTVRYNDIKSKKITSVDYIVPIKNTMQVNDKWGKLGFPHSTMYMLKDVKTYTNKNIENIKIMDITQKV